jgi:hypothetical protein
MTDGVPAYDEDRLPWLEPVDEEDAPRGISARRMIAALVVVLLAVAIVAGTFFWLGRDGAATGGAPELIRAPAQPYKIRPADPGGLDVAGESETAYRTSAGQDLDSQLDLGELNKESVTRRAAPTAPQTPEAEDAAPDPVAKPEPAPAPSGASGSVIQLGAYKTQTQAQRGWDALSARFPVLSGLTKMIVPYSGGYRLRAAAASPGAADDACKAVKAGGGNCFVAN